MESTMRLKSSPSPGCMNLLSRHCTDCEGLLYFSSYKVTYVEFYV
jgi:hypothetical protein